MYGGLVIHRHHPEGDHATVTRWLISICSFTVIMIIGQRLKFYLLSG